MTKKKIGMVVQRYGLEVNGGSELHARQLAELLSKTYDVEVLTTCAIDYITWQNEYPAGLTEINGVSVRRFPVKEPRKIEKFNQLSQKIFSDKNHSYFDELEWMKQQGPLALGLLNYLRKNKSKYDVIIFMTYLYFTTYFGLHIAPEKSILVPTAHDEPPIYLSIYYSLFHLPRAIMYNTIEEREFIHGKFKNDYIPSQIAGVGVEVPNKINAEEFRNKYDIGTNMIIGDKFILYIGRVDPSKGCDELFNYFIKYKERNKNDIKLVLMGKPVMQIPKHPDIIPLGFVSDQDKFNGISAAELVVMPSHFESLSMVVLESMKLGKPVLVNGQCKVLKGHCIRSNAGLYYTNFDEFEECLNVILSKKYVVKRMGINGKKYVSKNYNWFIIEQKFIKIIDEI
ncbi:MAG: hypothetical protein PWQ82_1339 [Thermosediminibacterales bacterium]|nr:hypothetical protein [Thermosediminibacterales bacterium]MDK2835605.1 hypothetical protein [Thermosediminibacterales bacterium]